MTPDLLPHPDGREERLPKWARDELKRLRSEVAELRGVLHMKLGHDGARHAHATTVKPEGFYLEHWQPDRKAYLPVNPVMWSVNWNRGGREIRFYERDYYGRRTLEVSAIGRVTDLVVRPRSSNLVIIDVMRDDIRED